MKIALKMIVAGASLLLFTGAVLSAQPRLTEEPHESEKGFVRIFDGKTLDGWDGNPAYWSVKDGIIVGEITPETTLERNTFLIWRGGTTGDFELKLEYRISDEGNSGIISSSPHFIGKTHSAPVFLCAGAKSAFD